MLSSSSDSHFSHLSHPSLARVDRGSFSAIEDALWPVALELGGRLGIISIRTLALLRKQAATAKHPWGANWVRTTMTDVANHLSCSPDTARRAIRPWLDMGILVRKRDQYRQPHLWVRPFTPRNHTDYEPPVPTLASRIEQLQHHMEQAQQLLFELGADPALRAQAIDVADDAIRQQLNELARLTSDPAYTDAESVLENPTPDSVPGHEEDDIDPAGDRLRALEALYPYRGQGTQIDNAHEYSPFLASNAIEELIAGGLTFERLLQEVRFYVEQTQAHGGYQVPLDTYLKFTRGKWLPKQLEKQARREQQQRPRHPYAPPRTKRPAQQGRSSDPGRHATENLNDSACRPDSPHLIKTKNTLEYLEGARCARPGMDDNVLNIETCHGVPRLQQCTQSITELADNRTLRRLSHAAATSSHPAFRLAYAELANELATLMQESAGPLPAELLLLLDHALVEAILDHMAREERSEVRRLAALRLDPTLLRAMAPDAAQARRISACRDVLADIEPWPLN